MSLVALDIQVATALTENLPDTNTLEAWVNTVLENFVTDTHELTLRFVDEEESQQLNYQYRHKDKPTNVLSFPFECPPDIPIQLLGDLVICVPVVMKEATEQNKTFSAHLTHMIVHGVLHLLGYDHIEDDEAEEMESLEVDILAKLNIDDPYLAD